MNLGTRLRAGALSAGVLIFVAGCTTSTADGPTSTAIVSVTVSPSVIDPSSPLPTTSAASPSPSASAVESSPPTSVSSDISPQEAADRAAIEAQWIKLWEIYTMLARIPSEERQPTLASVTSSPLTENLITAAKQANVDGVDNYGNVNHRLFWLSSINGATTATIADCQDQSEAGTVSVATGQTLTTGRERINLRGDFIKGADGIWRARSIIDLGNSDC